MTIELEVQAGDKTLRAPVDSVTEAMLIASMLAEAGAGRIQVHEAGPAVAGAGEASCGEGEESAAGVMHLTYEGGDSPKMELGEEAQETALSIADVEEAQDVHVQAGDFFGDIARAMSPKPGITAQNRATRPVQDQVVRGITAADNWVDRNIFGSQQGQALLGALPYGNLIQDAHDIRRGLTSGRPSARQAQRTRDAAARRQRATQDEAARQAREQRAGVESARMSAATTAMVREAQGVTRAARRGEQRAHDRIRGVKTRAAQGDPEARRLWKIYVAVSDDDQGRIEAQLR